MGKNGIENEQKGFVLLSGGSVSVSIQISVNIWGGRIFLQILGVLPVMLNSLEFIPQGQGRFLGIF